MEYFQMNYKINIKKLKNKESDEFIIVKDDNFMFFIQGSFGFYKETIRQLQLQLGIISEIKQSLVALLYRLLKDGDADILTKEELLQFIDWVEALCIIMIESEKINFQDQSVSKYLKIAEEFTNKTKKLLKTKTIKNDSKRVNS